MKIPIIVANERDEDHEAHAEPPADLLLGHRLSLPSTAWKTPVPQGKPIARKYS